MVGERPAKPLKIGETQTIQVYANLQYNRSGVLLEKGAKYIFNVPPNQKWVDASIACDEKGWDRDTQALGLKEIFIRLSEGKRRYPSAKWFELIGAIGANDDHLFPVTTYLFGNNDFVPTLDGELYLFANDLNRMYGNNRGFITVKISRVG
jgi:hypothetical protein